MEIRCLGSRLAAHVRISVFLGVFLVPLGAAAVLLGPLPLRAQTVVGRVLDAASDDPVPAATVQALDEQNATVVSTTSDREGRFELRLARPGAYRIRVERLGYPAQVAAELTLGHLEQVEVVLPLYPEPITLPPVTVTARGPERGRHGFERRRTMGAGVFLDPVHVALREARVATDILRGIEGVNLDHKGDVHALRGWGCLVVLLDHMRRPIMHTGGDPALPRRRALGGHVHLNEFVDPASVRAVEVYRTIEEVPEEIRRGVLWSEVERCAVVWIWTRQGW
jgi:hypothetical protein